MKRQHLVLLILFFVGALFQIWHTSFSGTDFEIYKQIAEMDNPYLHPYCDFPPFKTWLFTFLFKSDLFISFWLLSGWASAGFLFVFLKKYYEGNVSKIISGGLLYFSTSLFYFNWYSYGADKSIYFLLSITVIISFLYGKYLAAGILTGILAAYSTIGLFFLPLYMFVPELKVYRKELIIYPLLIFMLSHLLYFPEWIQGYINRSSRFDFNIPRVTSVFSLFPRYSQWVFWIITSAGILFFYLRPTIPFGIAGITFIILGIRPDNSFDAALAGYLLLSVLLLDKEILTFLNIILMAGIGFRIGMNDNPGNVELFLMWIPFIITFTAVVFAAYEIPPKKIHIINESRTGQRKKLFNNLAE